MSKNSNNEKSIINLNEDDDENENEKTLSPKINREPICRICIIKRSKLGLLY